MKIVPFIHKPIHIIREDVYRNSFYPELFTDFDYYEHTSFKKINFDGYHDIPWIFFTVEGIAYLLPKLIATAKNIVDSPSLMQEEFIANFAMEEYLYKILDILPFKGISALKEWFEHLLFKLNENELLQIGEMYLWRNLDMIEDYYKRKKWVFQLKA